MTGKNLTDENEQSDKTYFPLILASESHVQEAKLKITSRDFNETKEIYVKTNLFHPADLVYIPL